MDNNLKPCPFCGFVPTVDKISDKLSEIACNRVDCHINPSVYLYLGNNEKKIAAWNTRPIETLLEDRIAKQRTEIEALKIALKKAVTWSAGNERARVLAWIDAAIAHPTVGITTLIALREKVVSGEKPPEEAK